MKLSVFVNEAVNVSLELSKSKKHRGMVTTVKVALNFMTNSLNYLYISFTNSVFFAFPLNMELKLLSWVRYMHEQPCCLCPS